MLVPVSQHDPFDSCASAFERVLRGPVRMPMHQATRHMRRECRGDGLGIHIGNRRLHRPRISAGRNRRDAGSCKIRSAGGGRRDSRGQAGQGQRECGPEPPLPGRSRPREAIRELFSAKVSGSAIGLRLEAAWARGNEPLAGYRNRRLPIPSRNWPRLAKPTFDPC